MRRLSVKVLLRFLSSYTHWNLVRSSESYHLYFVTKECEGEKDRLATFPPCKPTRRAKKKDAKPKKSRPCILKRSRVISRSSEEGKDVFIFSPIFETVEEAVQVGMETIENSFDIKSKRSSFDSLAWDDFLPYKTERESDGESSYDTIENSTDLDSKESTPFFLEDYTGDQDMQHMNGHEICVRSQADRLLKDMLKLRRDIEQLNCGQRAPEEENTNSTVVYTPHISSESSTRRNSRERILRNKLDVMTEEIKNEMQQKQQKEEKENMLNNQNIGPATAEQRKKTKKERGKMIEDDAKIRQFFENIMKNKGQHSQVEGSTCCENKTDPDNPKSTSASTTCSSTTCSSEPAQQTAREGSKAGKESRPTSRTSRSAETASKKKKPKVVEGERQEGSLRVEIPFCSHNQHSLTPHRNYASLERRKKKQDLQKVLTPADEKAAQDVLQDLLQLREVNSIKGQNKNQVLDSMISLISLSSTSLNLPNTNSSSEVVHFKDLFDFEVNLNESREVFAKLAMDQTSGTSHTLQELFPWSEREVGKEFKNLRTCLE